MEVEYTTETEVNSIRCNVMPPKKLDVQELHYGHASHKDVSNNDRPHNDGGPIIYYYNTKIIYYNITLQYIPLCYSIQYNNMLYRSVA